MNRALLGARAIIFTHEHGDHVTGVIRTPDVDVLAPKSFLTRTQANTLVTAPQFPEIRLTEEQTHRYRLYALARRHVNRDRAPRARVRSTSRTPSREPPTACNATKA